MIVHIGIFIVSVMISSFSQVLLKMSANIERKNKIYEYLNKYVIIAYAILMLSLFLTMIAYRKVNLALGAILEALGYVVVAIMSKMFLKENINKKKMLGMCIIIIGIIIFTVSSI